MNCGVGPVQGRQFPRPHLRNLHRNRESKCTHPVCEKFERCDCGNAVLLSTNVFLISVHWCDIARDTPTGRLEADKVLSGRPPLNGHKKPRRRPPQPAIVFLSQCTAAIDNGECGMEMRATETLPYNYIVVVAAHSRQ